MKKTILEKVADNKFNAVKQLVRFIRENDKNPGGLKTYGKTVLRLRTN